MTEAWHQIADWAAVHGFRLALIAFLTIVALIVARILTGRLIAFYSKRQDDNELRKRAATLGSIVKYVLSAVILSVAVMLLLDEFGIKLGPLLAAAGVIGIAVGFGAQHLVRDITNGFFIVLDDQIRVGDVVEVAGKSGLVESVSLRLVVLRDLGGNVHFIPNGQISTVTNMSKVFSFCLLDIGVAYREDVDEVIEIVRRVDEDLRNDEQFGPSMLEPIDVLGLDRFEDSALVIRARIKVKPLRQFVLRREFNKRLKKAFDAGNIEIPFPHVTLYMGEGKTGSAPALNVSLTRNSKS